jgi:hypothetical protein
MFMAAPTLRAQLAERFADGNFTTNPEWVGSTAQFTVNPSQQLQLNGAAAGTSYLATAFASTSLAGTEWEFWVRLNFAPSGSNFARLYLASDQSNLTQNVNGYYLQLGEAGSLDAVELFRQTGTARVSICRARSGAIASAFAIRVKVQRGQAGEWQLWVDYAGGFNFVLEATGQDAVHNTSAFAGWVCTYTISNATRFFLDDVLITPPARDTDPPELLDVEVASTRSVRLRFSERLDSSRAVLPANYQLDQSFGSPATVRVDSSVVLLNWNRDFINGGTYQLQVTDLADVAGNVLPTTTRSFLYFIAVPARQHDVRITEIMADPAPVVQLPEAEYVELFNRSLHPFQLQGWRLSDATTTALLPPFLLQPQQYVVLTNTSNVARFGSIPVLGVSGFPSLNNAGDPLRLQAPTAQLIDSVNYADSWYRNNEKKDGGWSLELIDPENVCAEETNWVASEAPAGGTPGVRNSVWANKPDVTGPKLIAGLASARELLLRFDEKLEKDLQPMILLEPPVPVRSVRFIDRTLREVRVETDELQTRQRYTVRISALRDCSGNEIQPSHNSAAFALPEMVAPGDVVLNEVLFNPKPNGVDFVEVYNASPKFLNLKDWAVANLANGRPANSRKISSVDLILEPLSYLVFTENPDVLKAFYPQGKEATFFKMDLPSLNDDAGSVVLVSPHVVLLDSLVYDERWHDAILKDVEGVSLERIDIRAPAQSAANWKSAPAAAGFATPGFVNANTRPESMASDAVWLEPEIFSAERTPAFSQIHYAFDRTGFVANVKVLDQQGRPIKTVAQNETLGFEGFLRWDGDDDQAVRVRSGYYIVWFEVFDLEGRVQTYRKRVVVAGR